MLSFNFQCSNGRINVNMSFKTKLLAATFLLAAPFVTFGQKAPKAGKQKPATSIIDYTKLYTDSTGAYAKKMDAAYAKAFPDMYPEDYSRLVNAGFKDIYVTLQAGRNASDGSRIFTADTDPKALYIEAYKNDTVTLDQNTKRAQESFVQISKPLPGDSTHKNMEEYTLTTTDIKNGKEGIHYALVLNSMREKDKPAEDSVFFGKYDPDKDDWVISRSLKLDRQNFGTYRDFHLFHSASIGHHTPVDMSGFAGIFPAQQNTQPQQPAADAPISTTKIDYKKLHGSNGAAYQKEMREKLFHDIPAILGQEYDELKKAGFDDMGISLIDKGKGKPAQLLISGNQENILDITPGTKRHQSATFQYKIIDTKFDGKFNEQDSVVRLNDVTAKVVRGDTATLRELRLYTETSNKAQPRVYSELREANKKGTLNTVLGNKEFVHSNASIDDINAIFNEAAKAVGQGSFVDDGVIDDPRLKKTKKTVDLTPKNNGQ